MKEIKGAFLYVPFCIIYEGHIMALNRKRGKITFGREGRYNVEPETSGKKKIIFQIITYVLEICIVIGLAYVVTKYGLMQTSMTGESMKETLNNGEEVLINKFAYKISSPERFDVVAYCQNSSEHSYLNIKRIVGLPGEKILIEDGKVYINGEELKEKVNVEPMNTGGIAGEEMFLEKNEYFLLGDNRNNSQDSRFSNVGTVVQDDIIGKVWFRMKPFAAVSSLNLKSDNEQEKE